MIRTPAHLMLTGAFFSLVLVACMDKVTVDKARGAVGTIDLVKQCDDLQAAQEAILTRLERLTQDQRDRLREINAIRRVTCTADLRALAFEVRAMTRGRAL